MKRQLGIDLCKQLRLEQKSGFVSTNKIFLVSCTIGAVVCLSSRDCSERFPITQT